MVSYATSRPTSDGSLIQTAKNLVETGGLFSKEYQTILDKEAKDRDRIKETKPDVVSSLKSSQIF